LQTTRTAASQYHSTLNTSSAAPMGENPVIFLPARMSPAVASLRPPMLLTGKTPNVHNGIDLTDQGQPSPHDTFPPSSTTLSGINKPPETSRGLSRFRVFGLSKQIQESRRADSNRWPRVSLRVIIYVLQGFARHCKSRISKPLPLLCPAKHRIAFAVVSKWCRGPGHYELPAVPLQTRLGIRIFAARSMRRQGYDL
jgi:hypothetical protein